jgi:hypothetical protein
LKEQAKVQAPLVDLLAAHDEVAPVFRAVPDASLDWRLGEEEFTVKQILVHLTHANDFYLMIVEAARADNFDRVRLHTELPGWQRMAATDAEASRCTSVAALYECFERAFQRLLIVLTGITAAELERPFVLYELKPTAEPHLTTLKQRVLHMAASHLREHQVQLSETLASWWSTNKGDQG